jgi:hypothetical protein
METKKMMEIREEYLAKAKEIEYRLKESCSPEIKKDESELNMLASKINDNLKEMKPHEYLGIIKRLQDYLKESLEIKATEAEKELHYLKDVNQAL